MPSSKNSLRKGNLTNAERLEICLEKERNPKISQAKLAHWAKEKFDLVKAPTQPTISHILEKKHEYENMESSKLLSKRLRPAACLELDNALANWVLQC